MEGSLKRGTAVLAILVGVESLIPVFLVTWLVYWWIMEVRN